MESVASVVTQARDFLSALTSTEAKLAWSAIVLLVAILLTVVIVPRVIRRVWSLFTDRFVGGRIVAGANVLDQYVPTTAPSLLVRGLQSVILFGAGVALLVVWGGMTEAWDLLVLLKDSIPMLTQLLLTIGLAIGAYIAIDQLEQAIDRISQQADWMTDHQQEIVVRMGQLTILVVAGLLGLTIWNINLQGLLVGAGFLGIVVGFAARQTLGSIIAGFVLMFSRPFTIGDWVQIGEEEGVVTDITIVNTRLENFDGEVVVIPNDRVSDKAIVNRSERGLLRLRVDVGIDYESNPERAKEVALETIKTIDVIADAPPPQIVPKAFGDSAIVMEMRFWIDHPTPPRKWNAVENVVTSVKSAFEREDIKIPFPQRELTGRAESGGFTVRDAAAGSPESSSRSTHESASGDGRT
ncbi:mechanosensitive ion channel family protein [Halorhabdus sp. CUG00001]|uniref:mechanosensitive ion channel family protein n=1 Tax=Halorhabdus sp. CUG00001 TaxID=2600297 RepID=UPI00131DE9FD|nr:mechanosensitive ion channel family protein [Halorhabdus sp. CUG00001]